MTAATALVVALVGWRLVQSRHPAQAARAERASPSAERASPSTDGPPPAHPADPGSPAHEERGGAPAAPPDSPAAREARLMQKADAAAAGPVVAPGTVGAGFPAPIPEEARRPISAEARRRADAAALARTTAPEPRRPGPVWPAFEETDPPPGPPRTVLSQKPPAPRPARARVGLPARLDRWGE
jgi:hypothetical protein